MAHKAEARGDLLLSACALALLGTGCLIGAYYLLGFGAAAAAGTMADGSQSQAVARASGRITLLGLTAGALLGLTGVVLIVGFLWTLGALLRPAKPDQDA